MNYQKHDVALETFSDGTLILTSNETMSKPATNTGAWLHHWVEATPDAVFIAERSGAGWRALSYRETLERVRALAGGLMARGVIAGDRILVISGNSVDHGLLALAAQYIGAAIVAVAEQYALIPDAHPRLLHAAQATKPKLIFADDGERYGAALAHFEPANILVSHGGNYETLDGLLAATEAGVDEAYAQVTPETIAKILMTSGSSSAPKAVPTTHKMLTSNQAQLADAMPFLRDHAPAIVDWLPWNHVFGGSHNFNMMLANGGALYIDDGKPTEKLIGRTVENLKLQTGTLSFNVPVGYDLLVRALLKDDDLARRFFSELELIFYAGASLPQEVWEALETLALTHRGELPLMTSSWGLTETAPACIMQKEPIRRSGVIGVPLAGVSMKMIPGDDGRYEVRVKGPNVFDGYLDAPEKTAEAFDEDGYFITGDAMAFLDESDPNKGLRFDGRISEEFKLLTGTWVRAGALRLELLAALNGLASDLVITGADRDEIGLMIFPQAGADMASIEAVLKARAAEGQSSSTHIARAILLDEPPSISEGEITAKGNLNFRKILERRSALLDQLYEGGEGVIVIGRGK